MHDNNSFQIYPLTVSKTCAITEKGTLQQRERLPFGGELAAVRLTEGCYPGIKMSYRYDSIPFDPASLRPFGAPPLTGEAWTDKERKVFLL